MPLPKTELKAYNELIANALEALPGDTPKGVKDFMGKKVRKTLEPSNSLSMVETGLMANLWAAMGYQDSLRYLFDALMIRAVNEDNVRGSSSSIYRATLAWPALYANLTGYAQLFNRTTVPGVQFTHDVPYLHLTDPTVKDHASYGTIEHPGAYWTMNSLEYPVKSLLEDMTQFGAHRMAVQGNDRGWDRARFDTELELYATSLRAFLGQGAAKPDMPEDPHVLIPDGFTHFPNFLNPNNPNAHLPHDYPAGGLEHLPAPIAVQNPIPATLAAELGLTPEQTRPATR